MPIFFGAETPSALYLGAEQVNSAYLGTEKVWPTARITHWTSPHVSPLTPLGCGPGYGVTVFGEGLATAQIYFGGVLAETLSTSAGEYIHVRVPDNAGGYQGHDTPITATVNGVQIEGVLPFVTYEHYAGYAYNSDVDILLPEDKTWRVIASFPLLGCRAASYLKCEFYFGNSAIQWVPFESGIKILLPRTGQSVLDLETRTITIWSGTLTLGPIDQHAGELCEIWAFADSSYDDSNTVQYHRLMQQTTASEDPEASQGGLPGEPAPEPEQHGDL